MSPIWELCIRLWLCLHPGAAPLLRRLRSQSGFLCAPCHIISMVPLPFKRPVQSPDFSTHPVIWTVSSPFLPDIFQAKARRSRSLWTRIVTSPRCFCAEIRWFWFCGILSRAPNKRGMNFIYNGFLPAPGYPPFFALLPPTRWHLTFSVTSKYSLFSFCSYETSLMKRYIGKFCIHSMSHYQFFINVFFRS